ncbi:MAG TPA: hypothetical protein VEC12_03165 [Bacteroidia bacterium]|nr:hypothetical protein [Bacteroidia bacterium]
MKKLNLLLAVLLVILASCSGSDTYQGKWKATDAAGNKFEIDFAPKSVTIKGSKGDSTLYEYTQNSINIENSVETYGINLDDGRTYSIHFPIADDESKGVIMGPSGNLIYTIDRKKFTMYEGIYKLK